MIKIACKLFYCAAFLSMLSCSAQQAAQQTAASGALAASPAAPAPPTLEQSVINNIKTLSQLSGNMYLYLTDTPAPFQNLKIVISAIAIQSSADAVWHPLTSPSIGQPFDLLALQNANVLSLAGVTLPSGSYSNIRFTFKSVEAVALDGTGVSIDLASASQQVSFPIAVNQQGDFSTGVQISDTNNAPIMVVIDLNAQNSLSANGSGYVFNPTGSVVLVSSYANGALTNLLSSTSTQATTTVTTTVFSISSGGPYVFTVGSSASASTSSAGGSIVDCQVSPALPAGLSLASTCAISGTPTTAVSSATYSITAENGAGQFASTTIDISVNNQAPIAYTIGGTLTGLGEGNTVVLQDNVGDKLTLGTNGNFDFALPIVSGASYVVSVQTQPTGQTCMITGGSGTIPNANVTGIAVSCESVGYTIGGTVSGLSSGTLVLQNNGGDNLSVTGSTFTFATPVGPGDAYLVTILTQPNGLFCTILENGHSDMTLANVTDVTISCRFICPPVQGELVYQC